MKRGMTLQGLWEMGPERRRRVWNCGQIFERQKKVGRSPVVGYRRMIQLGRAQGAGMKVAGGLCQFCC